MKTLLALALVFFSGAAFAEDPAPVLSLKTFYSDGCTGFVDGPPGRGKLWQHCCFEHDLRYWFGGTKDDQTFADRQLRSCVRDVAGTEWARVIYRGVRIGHRSPIKAKTHWSWGWRTDREKVPLTPEEIEYVESELRALPLEPDYIETFIKKYLRKL